MSAALKQEIAQQRPFTSPQEEALLNLMRTADCLNRAFQLITRKWGITSTQYNVLRILRGAHPAGLPCSVIGSRMITAEPDITRLLARLKAQKLIRQQRDRRDRRVVLTFIADPGLELLSQMDSTIQTTPQELLGQLEERDVAEFTRLLELARRGCDHRVPRLTSNGTPSVLSCDGATEPPTCDGLSCDGTAKSA